MRVNCRVIAFLISASLLSGCSFTEEKKENVLKDKNHAIQNETNDSLTRGYQNDSTVSGKQLGLNGSDVDPQFSDPNNPLSKRTIYFSYDNSQVDQKFVDVIAAHSQYLVNHTAAKIVLGGHADERGSREYNVALSEQRAKAVSRMMGAQGVARDQIEVVGYGEEKPASDERDESSWQLNRRVEIVYQDR